MEQSWSIKLFSIKIFIFSAFFFIATLLESRASLLKRSPSGFKHSSRNILFDTNGREFAYKSIRIPKDIRPLHYDLLIHPNLKSLEFDGKVDILLKCFRATRRIIFHLKELKIGNIKLVDEKNSAILVEDISESKERNLVILKLGDVLHEDKEYHLAMDFRGTLSNDMEGFYKSIYRTKSGETRLLATTKFEPVQARRAFPCFDEPELKATFEIKILRSKRHRSISNMPIKKTIRQENGLFLDHFQRSVKMSTYLVAFIVSDFEYTETTTTNGIRVRVWAKKDALEQTRFGLNVAQHVLTYYEKFFNIKYPLPKMDLIAVPDFKSGAMENWGLVTFREALLLFDPKSSNAADKQRLAHVVAHELAHQWFGNLVTMKWWNDLWLNEGFAEFVQYLGTDDYAKEWRVLEQFASDTLRTALDADSFINTHPISVPVQNPSEIKEIFDKISYDKGSSVIRMLRSFLGDKTFRKGLEQYLRKHAYENAEADDLWDSLSKVSGSLNVKAIMDSWIKQKGYPVVTIRSSKFTPKSSFAEQFVVSQQRFLIDPFLNQKTTKEEIGELKWYIPLTYITQTSNKEHLMWINQTSSNLLSVGNSGWIKANINQMGLYRVNYDAENWRLLTDQLMQDHNVFSAVDRSGLLNDAFSLARAGFVQMTIPLKLTQYLNKEKEYLPWSSALNSLCPIGNMIYKREAYKLYEKYLVKKLKPLELSLKWEDKGTMLDKYLRTLVLGFLCKHGDQGCIGNTQKLFAKFVHDDSKISPHLRAIVYATVTEHGGITEWEFLWSKYKEETDATHKIKLMAGLTSTRKPWLLSRLMNYALSGEYIRQQDMVSAIILVSSNPFGRQLAWQFYKEHFDGIVKRVGRDSNDCGTLFERITELFNTETQLKEVQDFIQKHSSVFSGKRASKKAVENIEGNINWMKTHYNTVFNWLKNVNNNEN